MCWAWRIATTAPLSTLEIPLAEILRYGTDLRSMTQGRGIYTIEFGRYEAVPNHLADQVISQSKEEEAEQE